MQVMERPTLAKTGQHGQFQETKSTGAISSGHGQSDSFARFRQAFGNRTVGRLIQAKLTVNRPGEVYEQEADRVADAVMRMSAPPSDQALHRNTAAATPSIQRQCACEGGTPCPKCEEEKKGLMQRKIGESSDRAGMSVPDSFIEHLKHGNPLDLSTRSFFESRFAEDFSQVRLHADDPAAESARRLNALAFTVGNNIVMGAGQFAPSSPAGQRLLAHELTHVVQQRNMSGVSSGLSATTAHQGVVQRQELIPIPELAPDFSPEFSPDFSPELAPDFAPEFEPEIELDPEISPEIEPEVSPEVSPEPVPEISPEPAPELAPEPTPIPEPFPPVVPQPQPQPKPPEDEEPEPDCGSKKMPLTMVSFFPGSVGQGGRVKASPLTRCPGNTIGSPPDNRIYRPQFDCITAAGQRGSWVRAHILHGRTSSSGRFNLHGPGDDMRNLIIADQSLNQTMRSGAEGPAINRVWGNNEVLWYESKVDTYAPGLDYFAQSLTVRFGSFDTTTGMEGPQLGRGTFTLSRTPPYCPATSSVPVPSPSVPTPPKPGTAHPSPGRSSLKFQSTLNICHKQLTSSHIVHVSDGGLEVRVGANWFDSKSNKLLGPPRCPIRDFSITLMKQGLWDSSISTATVPVGRGATVRWKHLDSGDYYLKINTTNSDSSCCLRGDIGVGTFSAPRPVRMRGPGPIA
jgi:hypothetical protein